MKRRNHGLKDIWDGTTILQDLSTPGQFFNSKNNLALSLNTDGVPLYKSSSWSLWPVFLSILNLPASIRLKAENVLLTGLWYGPSKPPMKLLLYPILASLRELSVSGVVLRTPTGLQHISKADDVCFYLPAKAAVLCAKQYNGEHGCALCVNPGVSLSNGARIYHPQIYSDRTHEGVLRAAEATQDSGHAVEGIKAISPLSRHMDLVLSVPIDYIHAVLECVVTMLIKCWFNSSHHREAQYIGQMTRSIDGQLI